MKCDTDSDVLVVLCAWVQHVMFEVNIGTSHSSRIILFASRGLRMYEYLQKEFLRYESNFDDHTLLP